ncbi:helix-turn-helix DNA-binding domain protein [Streptomyces phage Vondra]|uniref:Helix-turn-helix DNA binding domain protein n=1 Tax=Streptomyces phage Vondra TaxID=2736273 RepID=A0A6M9Z5L9_9CAUD|nr:helix-turn-helix DNA-binding domain protein [Streptomyces phage Vondra]QKN87609.1 helix-turn-helix DNA-binding domain protein [Streptomyces phage Vondra]
MDGEDFIGSVREALRRRGMSIRAAARELSYDHAYLSRVLAGKQDPSPHLVDGLRALVGTGPRPLQTAGREIDAETYVRSAVAHLLQHTSRYGGTHVADAVVQVWRAEQSKVDRLVEPSAQLVGAVSEIAQIAGWILFDAHRTDEARRAFVEAQMLARQAGDGARLWFALDMLSMQGVQEGRPGEVLRLADELRSTPGLPPRVALITRVRRARALAQAGERARSLAEMDQARGALQESVSSRDPAWVWWITEAEVVGHLGEVLMSLGDHAAAVPHFQRARDATPTGGRRWLECSVAELSALTAAGAWRDCDALFVDLVPLLDTVASTRSRARLAQTLRVIERDAPPWLAATARDVAEAC